MAMVPIDNYDVAKSVLVIVRLRYTKQNFREEAEGAKTKRPTSCGLLKLYGFRH